MTMVSSERPTGDDPPSEGPDAGAGDEDGRSAVRDRLDLLRDRFDLKVPEALRRATWRFYVFVPVLVVLIIAVPLLAWKGFSILRTEDTGQVVSGVTDPTAPGFEALVTPTPTALLVDIGADGALAGVTLITRPSQSGGGNLMFFPTGTLLEVPLREPPEATLSDIFAEGGVDALKQRVESLLGAGITEVIEVPAGQWESLLAPVTPLTVQNPVAVETTNAAGQPVAFPDGEIQLSAAQIGLFLQARAADEIDTVRLTRHDAFWTAWLAALDESGPSAVPGEGATGIGGFVRGLTGGPRNLMTLPATPVPVPGAALFDSDLFRPDMLALVATVPDLIPFPVGVGRLRTRLVMGVEGETDTLSEITRALVRSGSEITTIANDDAFDEEETVVYFFREDHREKAERLLDALGTGELVRDRALSDNVDVVVVIGQDYVDALGGEPPDTSTPSGISVPDSIPTGGVPGGGIPGGVTPGAPGGDPVG